MVAQMHDVEARLAGAQLDHRLLALLLFRRRLGIDLDAGQLLELGEVFEKYFAARAFHQIDFERRAGKALPVDAGGSRPNAQRGCGAKSGGTRPEMSAPRRV